MRWILALSLALWAGAASAQSVIQSGFVTPGHPMMWVTNGVAGDGGTPAQGNLTGLGVTASGPGICQASGSRSGPYNQICLGTTQTGGGVLSINNYNGATGGFSINVNGSAVGLGVVILPTVSGDASCFTNTTGTMHDCGVPPGGIPAGSNTDVQYNGSGAFAGNAGFTYDGTSVIGLGVAGTSVGGINVYNATSGSINLTPPTGALGTVAIVLPGTSGNIPVTAGNNNWTNNDQFQDGVLALVGSVSGFTVLHAPATGGGDATFFQGSDTIIGRATTDTLTNKTLVSSTNLLGGVTADFGSDAKGDIYTNGGSSNVITRLAIGSTGNCLVVAAGLPSWGSCSSGSGTVTSATIAAGSGIGVTGTCTITTSGTCTVANTGVVSVNIPTPFTSSGTYSASSGLVYAIIEGVGGGAGGGGAAAAGASANNTGNGGGAGGRSRALISATTAALGLSVTIGSAGSGGAAGNNPGTAGGNTTVGISGVTVTIASPGVFTLNAHGLYVGQPISFTTSGALPTGLTAGTEYFVISAGLTANAFEVSTSAGGAAVNTSGSQSGTHSLDVLVANGGNPGGGGTGSTISSTVGTGGAAGTGNQTFPGMAGEVPGIISGVGPISNNQGASTPYGSGGYGAIVTGAGGFNGQAGTGYGTGGSGGFVYSTGSATASGGNGTKGWVGITEFIN